MHYYEKIAVDIIKSSAAEICYINNELKPKKGGNYLKNKILFPLKRQRENIVRISEQELRVLFCQELFKRDIHFSIETPTKNKYKYISV